MTSSAVLPDFLDGNFWEIIQYDNGDYCYRDKQGVLLTSYRAFLLNEVFETHKRRDGQIFRKDWDAYKACFASIAMLGDYRDVSITREAVINTAHNDLLQFPDEVWRIMTWPYRGRQFILKVLDTYQGNPTPYADWFYINSGYYQILNLVHMTENYQAQSDWNDFFADVFRTTGKTVHYISHDENNVYFEDKNFKGDRNLKVYTLPELTTAIVEQRECVVYELFLETMNSYEYDFKWYIGKASDDEYKMMFELLLENNWLEIDDFHRDIDIPLHFMLIPYLFKRIKSLTLPNEFDPDDDVEYIVYFVFNSTDDEIEAFIHEMNDNLDFRNPYFNQRKENTANLCRKILPFQTA